MNSPIRVHRKGLGLTQGQLALLVGVSPATVAQWERGEFPPPVARTRQMAELMGLDGAGFQTELLAHKESVRRDVVRKLEGALVA